MDCEGGGGGGGGGVDHRPEVKSIFQVRCNLSNTIISI